MAPQELRRPYTLGLLKFEQWLVETALDASLRCFICRLEPAEAGFDPGEHLQVPNPVYLYLFFINVYGDDSCPQKRVAIQLQTGKQNGPPTVLSGVTV